MSNRLSRRHFIQTTAAEGAALAGLATILQSKQAPAAVVSSSERPAALWGLQIGDVSPKGAIVWSRTDRPARFYVDWSLDASFANARRVRGPHALETTDYTARVDLQGLPPGADVFVRTYFESLDGRGATSEPVVGRFKSAPKGGRDVRFVWSGDTAGQGWGIDLGFGGMKIYEAMRRTRPDFFLHSGDTIYADGPLSPEVTDAAGNVIWRNAYLDVVPEKLKVAETLHEFRRAHLYNRYDANQLAFSAEVPQIWQWDDHEITNNWSASKVLDDRYVERSVAALVARGTRAFLEYAPMRWHSDLESERVYRHVPYGPDLDLFVVDLRSYRAANGCNLETEEGPSTRFFGRAQLAWLAQALSRSTATWKVICSDMPIGLIIGDGTDPDSGCARAENVANLDGPALGRELELARLLSFIAREHIQNVVWLTADVHYCAAHHYHPSRAQFRDFEPFWEFVAGPLHAGSFGPGTLDDTFGPEVVFEKAPPPGQSNLPPSAGLQFFGQVDLDHQSKALTIALKDLYGDTLFEQRLAAAEPRRRDRRR